MLRMMFGELALAHFADATGRADCVNDIGLGHALLPRVLKCFSDREIGQATREVKVRRRHARLPKLAGIWRNVIRYRKIGTTQARYYNHTGAMRLRRPRRCTLIALNSQKSRNLSSWISLMSPADALAYLRLGSPSPRFCCCCL
jgi:hypothetical protein